MHDGAHLNTHIYAHMHKNYATYPSMKLKEQTTLNNVNTQATEPFKFKFTGHKPYVHIYNMILCRKKAN